MALAFRNLTVTPDDPVEQWGFEGILAAIDRGNIADWRKIRRALDADPWGDVSLSLAEAFVVAEDRGAVGALTAVLAGVREKAAHDEREEVAAQIRQYVEESGLTQAEFSARVGTSAPRLSTYATGKTVPSAAMMLRMARVAEQLAGTATAGKEPRRTGSLSDRWPVSLADGDDDRITESG